MAVTTTWQILFYVLSAIVSVICILVAVFRVYPAIKARVNKLRAAGIKLRDTASLGLHGLFRLAVLPPAAQDALFEQLQRNSQVGKVLQEDEV